MDVQRETIIPRHYRVAEYKKTFKGVKSIWACFRDTGLSIQTLWVNTVPITVAISNSKGLSEIHRDTHTSRFAELRKK